MTSKYTKWRERIYEVSQMTPEQREQLGRDCGQFCHIPSMEFLATNPPKWICAHCLQPFKKEKP
jgi:hypothetical protein